VFGGAFGHRLFNKKNTMTEYIFADTETTDAGPTASVCEVGWIRTDADFNILETVQSLIDPQQRISPGASGIHGLVNADVEDSPTLAEYFSVNDPACFGRKLPADAIIVGHRIGFDMRFLAPYFEAPPVELDTLRWVRKLYPDMDDHKLSTCIFALGLPRSAGAHRVMADVMSAYHLCRHICDRTNMTLPELAAASAAPMELAIYPFGKHKGVPFRDVPKSYLRWARESMKDLDQDMSFTINTLLK
jgi:DNA polymerase III epsilon subunit-like protein